MSDMLEQAIVDAEALKEAALKTAESSIIEKYSSEIKKTMNSLLEQAEEIAPTAPEDEGEINVLGTDTVSEEEVPDMPRADLDETDLSKASEDQVVDIDLTKLAEELKKELDEDDSDVEEQELEEKRRHKDRLEGHPTGPNRERLEEDPEEDLEDLGIEEELLNSILEKLSIDVKNVPTGQAGGASNETMDKEREDIALAQGASEELEEEQEDDGKKELEEEVKTLQEKNKKFSVQNKKFKNMILQLKEKLEEVNLSNAKLLYTNRILDSVSLNERQKNKIVEALSNADSVEEAKVVYETLQSAVGSTKKRAPKSLSEAVERSSATLPRRKEENKSNPFNDRWKTLAGIK
jgi:hypothetical protein